MNYKELFIFILMLIAYCVMSTIDFNSLVACGVYVID